jgi:hypothetical protein
VSKNAALRKVYDEMEIYDGDGVMEAAEDCVDLALPLLEENYNRRMKSDETIKLQIVVEYYLNILDLTMKHCQHKS